ncbi:MAG: lipoate--protein ligase family protein [bacterium]|nr:lipoate--protein ligase family protein [bacterium]
MSRWRLFESPDLDPGLNMGLDEALLESDAPPTLRLYGWSPDTLSLGYFQRFADVPATRRASRVVRRITGGGAIHHDAGELTFALTCAAHEPPYDTSIPESYARVHGAVIEALAAVGVDAKLRDEDALASERTATGMCFHASTPLDIVWLARKGVGSAQRRRAGRVLHHGSIKVHASELEEGVASFAVAGSTATRGQVGAALVSAFERLLDARFESAEPSPELLAEARERGARYLAKDFVRRR